MPQYPASISPVRAVVFWALSVTFLILTWLGRCPATEPYSTYTRPAVFCFYLLMAVYPMLNRHFDLLLTRIKALIKLCVVLFMGAMLGS